MPMSLIADNLASVKQRMAEAARKVGRDPQDVRLVVVTKTVPVERYPSIVAHRRR